MHICAAGWIARDGARAFIAGALLDHAIDAHREHADLAPGQLFGRPGRRGGRIDIHEKARVVAHQRVSVNADREPARQLQQPLFDPGLAVLEVVAGIGFFPAKVGATHAARDGVVEV